ncbi:MAG: tRNA pseudouridine(13) synthase TruD [Pseudomonadota bacterium]
MRAELADFRVVEQLGFEPDNDGPHTWLNVRKLGATTPWVAKQLAEHCGIAVRDVGYSGLKDRHAITEQWFSVPLPADDSRLQAGEIAPDVEIVARVPARRKLKRGTHRGNDFELIIRDTALTDNTLAARIDAIRRDGFPNYFGPQRFGREFGNLGLADRAVRGQKLRGPKREYAISAARSFLFNGFVGQRVAERLLLDWQEGDRASLDGSRSHFSVDLDDPDLMSRTANGDIHPSATLWGREGSLLAGPAANREQALIRELGKEAWCDWLERGRSTSMLRPVRVRASALTYQYDAANARLRLQFGLPAGSFATALLAEIVDVRDVRAHSRVSSNT